MRPSLGEVQPAVNFAQHLPSCAGQNANPGSLGNPWQAALAGGDQAFHGQVLIPAVNPFNDFVPRHGRAPHNVDVAVVQLGVHAHKHFWPLLLCCHEHHPNAVDIAGVKHEGSWRSTNLRRILVRCGHTSGSCMYTCSSAKTLASMAGFTAPQESANCSEGNSDKSNIQNSR